MKTFLTAVLVLVGLQTALLAQAITVTVTFDPTSGINSGSAVPLLSFKIGVQQSGLVSQAGGGASAGKSQFTPLTLFKSVDQTTPQLFLACALGKVIKSATLVVSSTDGVFFQIVLTNVIISAINDDSTNSDGGVPFESFSLSYSKIGWKYTPLFGGVESDGGFDVKKNLPLSFSALLPPQ